MSGKRVRVTMEVDSHFISLLNANVQLGPGGLEDFGGRDVAGILAGVFLLEARGAPPEQVHACTPPQWRPHIEAMSDERKVFDMDGNRLEKNDENS